MGFGNNAIKAGSLDVDKSKGKKKVDFTKNERRWWVRCSFFGSCIPSKSKIDSSIGATATTSTHHGNFIFLSYTSSLDSENIFHLISVLGSNEEKKSLFMFI